MKDKDKIEKIVAEAEKIANDKIIDKKKVVALTKEIDRIIRPAKYFKRIT